ncbi:expressed unknown protein [Seminavis robusta]|uniref:Uncharacterized protein n=1 Tax=Seminavis robusta TaxID=568900 RepID=A0A9N8HKB6_9STRA|nr:expressed unknown protein [Seminavis robusta]|eukprot:Sro744_g196190.1 n/a (546) ;mRNA; r:18269-19906
MSSSATITNTWEICCPLALCCCCALLPLAPVLIPLCACGMILLLLLWPLSFILFAVAIFLITLVRFPVNLYCLAKIVLSNVSLEWDFKILALFMLPIANVAFSVWLFFSTLLMIFTTTDGLLGFDFNGAMARYNRKQADFTDLQQPMGVPLNWEGETYGIVRWRINLLGSMVLLAVSLPACLIGSMWITIVKIVPGYLSRWAVCFESLSRLGPRDPFLCCQVVYYVGATIIVAPIAVLVQSGSAILKGTLIAFRVPPVLVQHGFVAGLYEPLVLLHEIDTWDIFGLERSISAIPCLPETNPYKNVDNPQRTTARTITGGERRMATNAYWDRFAKQCIQTTFDLLEKGWITIEQVECMDPSIFQAIPAIAVLTVLVDTVHDPEAKKPKDISWKIDGTLCKQSQRPPLDNVAALLFPKVIEVKRLLCKKNVAKESNVESIVALICSNTKDPTEVQKASLRNHPTNENSKHEDTNNLVRARLTELTLMILQVKPFRDRMTTIFAHEYLAAAADEESAHPDAKYICQDVERQDQDSTEREATRGWFAWW